MAKRTQGNVGNAGTVREVGEVAAIAGKCPNGQ
jgi:hypothetical protein